MGRTAEDKTQMARVTDDGGVLKILLQDGDQSRAEPAWVRGTNARFHFKVFTYGTGRSEGSASKSEKGCSATHKHDHKHGKCSHGGINAVKALLQSKDDVASPTPADPGPTMDMGRPNRKLVSDSREECIEPFELRIGYSFSVKALEVAVKTMRVGERSRFLCMPEYTQGYVQLAKVLRQEKENRERATKGLAPQRVPMGCAHNMHQEMENQSDLAELNGVVLEFEIELLEVLQPDAYVREPWEMETMDKYREAPLAKDQGGQLYKAGKYKEALEKYTRALALLESVSMSAIVLDMQRAPASEGEDKAEKSEKTETELDLETLNSLMKSCRLNYAACNLKLNNLPPVIQQCSEVLKGDPKNLKALFRRGQAYSRLGRDLDLAQVDFDEMQSILDLSGLPKTASEWTELRKEQLTLQAKLKDCREREKRAFGNMFS